MLRVLALCFRVKRSSAIRTNMGKVKCALLNMSQSAVSMELAITVLEKNVESILSTVAKHALMKDMHITFQEGAQINETLCTYACVCV